MQDILTDKEIALVPLTGSMKVTLPSKEDRAALVASLEHESDKMTNGQFTVFEKEAFVASMLADYDRRHQEK